MTDRDDALRRELGWTGPEETDYEPPTPKPEPAPPPKPPVPSRPPVDFVAPDRGPSPSAEEDDERAAPPSSRWAAPAPGPEPGPQGGQPDAPPPPFLDPERPGGSFRQPPPRYGPPPGSPRDTGPLPTANRPEDGPWSQPPGWQPTRPTRPAGQTAPPPPPAGPPTGSTVAAPGYGPEAAAGASPAARVVRRPDPGRRPGARTPGAARAAAGVSRCTRPPSGWSISASRPTRSGRPSWRTRSSRCCAATTRSA